jgi:hypothetical protein
MILSKYSAIFKTKNGFGLRHEAGSRYSWTYFTEFSTEKEDSIYLIKIRKICSFEGYEEISEYPYEYINLNELNINDTLKSNCNCDSLWLHLEKKYE